MFRIAAAGAVVLMGSLSGVALAQEPKTVALDLTPAGIPAVVQAPVGAKAQKFLSTTRVSNGPHFSVEITPIYPMEFGGVRDVAKMEPRMKFAVDTPDTLVWESDGAPGTHSSHFYTTLKVGGKLHGCFDTRGYGDYSKADVDAMLAACRTLKAK